MTHAPPCHFCTSMETTEPVEVAEMMFGWDERFAYVTCSDCGSVSQADVPEDLGRFYPQDYYSVDLDPAHTLGRPGVRQFAGLVARSVLFGSSRLATAAQRVVRMRQFHSYVSVLHSIAAAGLPLGKQTRVLDVGCGSGIMIYALALAGIRHPMGVDPFAPADRHFDNGAVLLRRDLADVENTFDLIMFHHSLEHVPDPAASLELALTKLAPGGQILVRMPTVSSEAYEIYGADYYGLDAPRHISIPSRAGVDALAERVGLRVTRTRDDSTASQFWASEQVRRGIPLMAPNSYMFSKSDSPFSKAQIDAWAKRARELNKTARGDQSAWIFERA